jgi:hypothetical protein
VYENRNLHRHAINSGDTDRLRLKWRRLSDKQFVEFHFHAHRYLDSGIAELFIGWHGCNPAVHGQGALL